MPHAAAIDHLLTYWKAHAQPGDRHRAWLSLHLRPPLVLRRNQPLVPPRGTHCVYFVASGLLARVVYHESGKRRIARLVHPDEAIGTAVNLYTDKRPEGELVALLPTCVLQLPAAELRALKEADRTADDLVDAWREREKKRKVAHNALLLLPDERERCLHFRSQHPQLAASLTQQDIADYLNVSRDTVKRAFHPKRS